MDSSESISFSMDTTTDSIDVVGHFNHQTTAPPLTQQQHNSNKEPLAKSLKHRQKRPKTILLNGTNTQLNYHDEETISNRMPSTKQDCCRREATCRVGDDTPPPSSTSSKIATYGSSPSQLHLSHHQLTNNNHAHPSRHHHQHQLESAVASSADSSLANFISCSSETSSSSLASSLGTRPAFRRSQREKHSNTPSQEGKKSVLFDKVTVYHFYRSQGFTSVPTEGGATLGMKRKHFLRRRLSVDLYEEVRRRSRRQILLKIYIEKRKQSEQTMRQQQQEQEQEQEQQKAQDSRLRPESASSSQANTPDSDENNGSQDSKVRTIGDQVDEKSDTKVIDVETISNTNDDQEDDDDDESCSDYSDISDSELESDSFVFLQKLDVKIRRSLLRASGVGRIDPLEKKECKKIRDSRERSGCKCVGQCIPEYCECSRLGVRCHVDRASFPCGCNSDGCKNPEGRTEFDTGRVRRHYMEKIVETHNQLSSNEEELTATTPPSSTTSEESY